MRIIISDSRNSKVATVRIAGGVVQVEGSFPGGLTSQDLAELGFVYYETDERGDIVSRVREVAPAETLDYVRALQDALPPGFHVSNVESEQIEDERRQKRRRFEEELARIGEED